MKKRWIALYVENNIGVLAKIAGLFSGKAYNLESLTVGTTEDETVSRMTIGVKCTDETFEQIKKQLNRMVDIIKVIDLTDLDYIKNELLFATYKKIPKGKMNSIKSIFQQYNGEIIMEHEDRILAQFVNTEELNNALIEELKSYKGLNIIRGGSVAVVKP